MSTVPEAFSGRDDGEGATVSTENAVNGSAIGFLNCKLLNDGFKKSI